MELEENRRKAFEHLAENQEKVKGKFNKRARSRMLQKGDMVLMWDRRHKKPWKHKKFDKLWLDPYKIENVVALNYFYLDHLDGEKLPLLVNGQYLKIYYVDGM